MIARHSPSAHTAYHDLLRSLKDEAISMLRGTPEKVSRKNRAYWYDTYRIGSEVKKAYIGEDTPELSARIAGLQTLRTQTAERKKNRTRLVRILREEGLTSVDSGTGSLLSAMENAGVFRLGGTLVGTHAFRLYEGELGIRLGRDEAAMTDDVDIASFEQLSLALKDRVSPDLQQVLTDFRFEAIPSLDARKVWRWKQTRSEILVEFLTPSFEEDEGIRHLAALGVDAQSLHHLNYLLAEPIKAAALYRSGVLVQIPRPERFAIHKLIVADRRKDRLKSRKDLMQAEFLINVLSEDRPDELQEAYNEAMEIGPKWQKRIAASLDKLPETRKQLEV